MISIFTGTAKIIRAGLSTFGLAGGAGAGIFTNLYIKESPNFYIRNYIRINSYIKELKKKYKNAQIFVTLVNLDTLYSLLAAFENLCTFIENYQYILLFI